VCTIATAKVQLNYNCYNVYFNGCLRFSKVIETFESHNATIVNYFQDRLTNASEESFNAKIKAFKTQFRGVGDIRFFMYRLATLYS
jgi:transposase